MIQISLTAWCSRDIPGGTGNYVDRARGIVGELTEEQYKQVQVWLEQMAIWTDENR